MKTKVSVSRFLGSRAIMFSVILAALFLLPGRSMAGVLLNSDLLVTHAAGQSSTPLPADQAQPSVAYDPINNRYLTVWTDYRNVTSASCGAQGCGTDIYGAICVGTDTPGQGQPNNVTTMSCGDSFQISVAKGNQSQPKVAFYPNPAGGNSRYLVVWTDSRNGSNSQIWGQFVSPSGTLINGNFAISQGAGTFPGTNLIGPLDAGTVTSATSTTLTDGSKALTWAANQWAGFSVTATDGSGVSQSRVIVSSTSTQLTVTPAWTTIPDTTYTYAINIAYDATNQSEPDVVYDSVINRFAVDWLDIDNYDSSQLVQYQGADCLNPSPLYHYAPLAYSDNNQVQAIEVSPTGVLANLKQASTIVFIDGFAVGGNALTAKFRTQHNESKPRIIFSSITGDYFPAWSGMDHTITFSASATTITGTCIGLQGAPPCQCNYNAALLTDTDNDGTPRIKLRKDDTLNLIRDLSFGTVATSPALTADPNTNRILVSWEENTGTPTGFDILGQLVDPSNFVVFGNTIDISTTTGDQTAPALAYDNVNQRFLAAWEDARNQSANISNIDIYGQFIDPQGNLSGANIPITTVPGNQIEPAIAFGDVDFRKFFVTWSDGRDPSQADIYGQLLEFSQLPQLLVTDASGNQITNGSINFGNVTVGQKQDITFFLCNGGNAQLTINSMTSPDTPFSFTTPIPQTISPGPGPTDPNTTCYSMNVEFAPTAAGSYSGNPDNNFKTIILSDGGNLTLYFSGNGVGIQPLTITKTSLPAGNTTRPYGVNLTAIGGVYPYTWSVPGDSGTATGGTSTTLSDTNKAWTVNEWAGLPITITSGPGAGQQRSIASNTVTALTVTTPWTTVPDTTSKYTINLPDGLLLQTLGTCSSPTGTLTCSSNMPCICGTPTTAGTFPVTMTVTDNNTPKSFQSQTLSLSVSSMSISPAALDQWTQNQAGYGQNITVSGGTAPYSWSISAGTLPGGLQLLTTGTCAATISGSPTTLTCNSNTPCICGAPTVSGSYTFTVKVQDSSANTATIPYNLTINPALSILTTSLPNGVVGVVYSEPLVSTGGTPSVAWAITSGALPAGLTLNGDTGVISGTPTSSTTNPTPSFTVTATDSVGASISKALTLQINSILDITNATSGAGSPPGASMGTPYSYTFTAAGGTSPYAWSVPSQSQPDGLQIDPNTGVLSGTPAKLGTFTFIIQVKDTNGTTVTKTFSITVFNLPPALNNPVWTVGVPYNDTTLASATGQGPYTWAITAGNLPAGLTLAPSGVISGTATAAGTSNFTATATNSVTNASSSVPFTLRINPVLSITTTSADTGTVNEPYSQQIVISGGTAPYKWSVISGSLPDGLVINAATGAISGTPTATGSSTFTVQVTDATYATAPTIGKNVVSNTYTITVGTISISGTLPNGSIGATYNQQLTASGGMQPYEWSSSNLPPGLTIDASFGVISGTPTTAGVYTFSVQVRDNAGIGGAMASKTFTVTIYGPPVITTQALNNPAWTTGVVYSETSLAATGGQGSYKWTISAGSLPAGLSIAASNGAISGTPTGIGTFNFTVKVTDSTGASASKPFTIVINPPLSITTPLLGSGSIFATYNQLVGISGGTAPSIWSIISGSLPPGLFINATTGAISGTPTATGTYTFTVQVTDSTYPITSTTTNIAARSYTVTIGTQLAVSPASLDFGNQLVGTTTSIGVTLMNASSTNLSLISFAIGEGPEGFSLPSPSCPATLAPGQTCVLFVNFGPNTAGDFTSSLTITSSDPANPSVVVPLSGVGISSAISVPTQIDFGPVLIGATSAPFTITSKDTSLAPLVISSLIYPGTPFTIISDTCQPRPKTLAGGGTCTVTMVFNPTAKRTYSKYLTFNSNDPTTPVARVLITGQGIVKTPKIIVSPDSVDFGEIPVGNPSAKQTVTISNRGTGKLVFSAIKYPGGVFKVVSDTCTGTKLNPMTSCDMVLKFKPITVKQYAPHYLILKTNDPVQPKVRVTLNGTGTQ